MKRLSNIFEKIVNIDNLKMADKKARKGKAKQYGIKVFDKNAEENLLLLQKSLVNKTFKTSEYTTFKIYEPKEREVYRLPYYPDRIVHHAVMLQMEAIFVSTFTSDTYSCIKGRGIHAASKNIKKALRNVDKTKYCLKIDITKFYPSIDHQILKNLLRKKLKDKDLLFLIDEIIDSAPGLPIGNYLSQYLANYYLTFFDHWIKEERNIKHYFRYADDIVILSDNKEHLHSLLFDIRKYFSERLKLMVKKNYQIFPVSSRGIDVLGYVHFHTHVRLRPSIKKNFARAMARKRNPLSVASYIGWAKHANCKNLIKKLLYEPNPTTPKIIQRPISKNTTSKELRR